jgi:hypothetical protein
MKLLSSKMFFGTVAALFIAATAFNVANSSVYSSSERPAIRMQSGPTMPPAPSDELKYSGPTLPPGPWDEGKII